MLWLVVIIIVIGVIVVNNQSKESKQIDKKEDSIDLFTAASQMSSSKITKNGRTDKISYDLSLDYHREGEPYYLVFDTETNGLPDFYDISCDKEPNIWPNAVSISWMLLTKKCEIIEEKDFVVKTTFLHNVEAEKVHNITKEIALRGGVSIKEILIEFELDLKNCTILVAHNMDFDKNVIGGEFLRNGLKNPLKSKRKICTMKKGTKYCAIENDYGRGYKWPKLQELTMMCLAGNPYNTSSQTNWHKSSFDVFAAAFCLDTLVKEGVISEPMAN